MLYILLTLAEIVKKKVGNTKAYYNKSINCPNAFGKYF